MNAFGYYEEETGESVFPTKADTQPAPAKIQLCAAVEIVDGKIVRKATAPETVTETPAPVVIDAVATDPEPVQTDPDHPESDAARAWFDAIVLPAPADEDDTPHIEAKFYNHKVTVYRNASKWRPGYGFHTLSPQQKSAGRRSLGTGWGSGYATLEELRPAFERFLAERERVWDRAQARKAAKQAARAAFVNPYAVGDILDGSWGYDQTNVDYFQVIETGPRSLKLHKIAARTLEATGPDSARVVPVKDAFLDNRDPVWVTIQIDKRGHSVPSPIYGTLGKWDGTPNYESWGH